MSFSRRVLRENGPATNVIKHSDCQKCVPLSSWKKLFFVLLGVCACMFVCVCVCVCVRYLSVGRSTRWWQWGRRWRWKPAVPELHLSLRTVLRCESLPLRRGLGKKENKKRWMAACGRECEVHKGKYEERKCRQRKRWIKSESRRDDGGEKMVSKWEKESALKQQRWGRAQGARLEEKKESISSLPPFQLPLSPFISPTVRTGERKKVEKWGEWIKK